MLRNTLRSFVSLSIFTLFVSSIAFGQQTPRDVLERQRIAAAKKLDDAHVQLARAKKIFEPYRLNLEYAKSGVLAAQAVLERIERMRQPLVDLAVAITAEDSAAADIVLNPADAAARERLVEAAKDRQSAEEAFDDVLEDAEAYKDFAKKIRRRKSPEVALDELKVQYQKDLTKAEVKFTKEENRAAKAKKVFTDAEKAAEEAARELAPIEAALAIDGLRDELEGLKDEVAGLRTDLRNGFAALAKSNPKLVTTVTSTQFATKDDVEVAVRAAIALSKMKPGAGLTTRQAAFEDYLARVQDGAAEALRSGKKVWTTNQCGQFVQIN